MANNPSPPMELGDALEYPEFRAAGSQLLKQRVQAVRNFERQAELSARAEGEYQKAKASRYVEIVADVSATESSERIKGEPKVAEALINRELHRQLLHARRAEIEGIDEALATLRRVGDWSQALAMRGVA